MLDVATQEHFDALGCDGPSQRLRNVVNEQCGHHCQGICGRRWMEPIEVGTLGGRLFHIRRHACSLGASPFPPSNAKISARTPSHAWVSIGDGLVGVHNIARVDLGRHPSHAVAFLVDSVGCTSATRFNLPSLRRIASSMASSPCKAVFWTCGRGPPVVSLPWTLPRLWINSPELTQAARLSLRADFEAHRRAIAPLFSTMTGFLRGLVAVGTFLGMLATTWSRMVRSWSGLGGADGRFECELTST